jgi:hypothetical protein
MSANRWIVHVKEFASKHNMTYGEALKNTTCKATYRYYNQFLIKGAGDRDDDERRQNREREIQQRLSRQHFQEQKNYNDLSRLLESNSTDENEKQEIRRIAEERRDNLITYLRRLPYAEFRKVIDEEKELGTPAPNDLDRIIKRKYIHEEIKRRLEQYHMQNG